MDKFKIKFHNHVASFLSIFKQLAQGSEASVYEACSMKG